MSQQERYEMYCAWCQRIDATPADFWTWAKELSKISEVSAIRGYGANLVQTQ